MSNDAQDHNTAAIRQLLLAAFSPDDLRRFCRHRPTFRPVSNRFGSGQGLDVRDGLVWIIGDSATGVAREFAVEPGGKLAATGSAIGLGNLGRAMAGRLREQGVELSVWNRSRDKAAALGWPVADSPAALMDAVPAVMLCLADSDAVEVVLRGKDGLLAGDRRQLDHAWRRTGDRLRSGSYSSRIRACACRSALWRPTSGL